MKRLLKLILILLSALFINCLASTNTNVIQLIPVEFKSSINNDAVQLIDVRKPSEYAAGHIVNSVNINFLSDYFTSNIGKLNKEKPVYIYCRSGKRSNKSAIEFKKAGFTKIYNLKGGILNWESQGFDIQIKN